jgi:hypothetical protein
MAPPVAPVPEDVTLGEVYRALINYQAETNRRFDALSAKVETRVVGIDLYQVAQSAITDRVGAIERELTAAQSSRRGLTMAVVGAFATGVAGIIANFFINAPHH